MIRILSGVASEMSVGPAGSGDLIRLQICCFLLPVGYTAVEFAVPLIHSSVEIGSLVSFGCL
jgi:hypothetical protein